VRLSDEGPLRAEVLDAEYLGTTQIVTLATARGATVKARVSAETSARSGDRCSLAFRPEKLSLFQKATGRAVRSALHDGQAHG
jgi:multiple sugar transport system ATP-binding protein